MESSHDLERTECRCRVDIETEWVASWLSVADGREKCPEPSIDAIIADCFERQRKQLLLEKYNDLITRQYLRDERWLEYTLRLLGDLQHEEVEHRYRITIEEATASAHFELFATQLSLLCFQGTEGTVVHIEEVERQVRFHGISFNEVEERELLIEQFHEGADAVRTIEHRRREIYRQKFVEIVDEEWGMRHEVSEAQQFAWFNLLKEEEIHRYNTGSLLLWRVEVEECNIRIELEQGLEKLYELNLYPMFEQSKAALDNNLAMWRDTQQQLVEEDVNVEHVDEPADIAADEETQGDVKNATPSQPTGADEVNDVVETEPAQATTKQVVDEYPLPDVQYAEDEVAKMWEALDHVRQ